jgi:diacylglycerol O-acyltransferase / wax synthase
MTMAGRHGRLDRLTPLDMSNLRVEKHGLPMHVAALIVLESAGPGQPDLDRLRDIVDRRLARVPRLRQVLYHPPPGLGPPVWVDARDFDIREHVRVRPVPEPGDEAALLRACADLDETPLDRSRPLWQMWLLTGLAGGRRVLLIRLHHVVADGIAALAMLGNLIDPAPGTEVLGPPPWTPVPAPGVAALASDQLRRQALLLRNLAVRLRHPGVVVMRLGVLARQARQVAREGRAPRVSLNVPVTGPAVPRRRPRAGDLPDRCRPGEPHSQRRGDLLRGPAEPGRGRRPRGGSRRRGLRSRHVGHARLARRPGHRPNTQGFSHWP